MIELIESYFRYNLHGTLCVISSVFNLLVGLVVLSKDHKSPLHRSFFLINLTAFVWMFSWGMMSLVRSIENAYFWDAVSYLGSPLISPAVYLFSSRWLKRKDDGLRIKLAFYLGALFMVPLIFL